MSDTVFITGASRGIGRAAALTFAGAGYRVGVGYMNSREAALSLIAEIADMGGMAQAVQGDVSSYQDAERMVREVKESLGTVDVLINNAGVSLVKLFTDTDDAQVRRVFDVNVFGAMNCARAALPAMLAKKCSRPRVP